MRKDTDYEASDAIFNIYIFKSKERLILFLDCTSLNDLETIAQNEHVLNGLADTALVVHMADSNLLNSNEYKSWMKETWKDTQCVHLIMDDEFPDIDLEKVYELQAQLNLVNEAVFPLLHGQTEAFKEALKESLQKEKEVLFFHSRHS